MPMPKISSWYPVGPDSDFPIQNLPFGVYESPVSRKPHLCSALGDQIVDLEVLAQHGFFEDLVADQTVFSLPNLNAFIGLGKSVTGAVRKRLQDILDDKREEWDAFELADFLLYPQDKARMLLPLEIPNYTDFYSSEEHARNVGSLFRDPENALLPNWKHLPVGYHGRASSIVVSGTPIRRPNGQYLVAGSETPVFGPTRQLDFELEIAFVTGATTPLGTAIPIEKAEDHIFGFVLFNDWSARDIQAWEYRPLGPFLGKSFASTISPWVVTLEALRPLRCPGPEQSPPPLAHLRHNGATNFDLQLEVGLQAKGHSAQTICRTNSKFLYWSAAQQLAHQTSNGCPISIGDLYASGTISGPEEGTQGSLLEITHGGKKSLSLPGNQTRTFLEEGDTVYFSGYGLYEGLRIGFGACQGEVV